jgi:hypothetical protein
VKFHDEAGSSFNADFFHKVGVKRNITRI